MTWRTINELLHRNKTKTKMPDAFLLKNSNINVTNPVDIANKFNEYFVSVGPQLAKKFLRTATHHLKATLRAIMLKVCLLSL